MAVIPFPPVQPSTETTEELPPLQNGDHLDQPTFHARYQAMPGHVRAELIGGIVFMASPVRKPHRRHNGLVVWWLYEYEAATPAVEALDSGTTILGEDSEPEPDASLHLLPQFGGLTQEDERGYVIGAPELVVEVAHATEAIDLHRKKADYEQAGISEYLVLLLWSHEVRWFYLDAGRFQQLQPDADGILRSRRFPGLWLDPTALLNKDQARLREVLQAGLASPEHAAWLAQLSQQAAEQQ